MAKQQISTSINNQPVEFLCHGQQTILEALRDVLGLTGTKEGCGTGDCGACSVLLNGRLICSCLALAAELEGAELTTIEGIAEAGILHPIQNKLLEHAALQCGVCTPGIVMAAKALLEQNAQPTDAELRYWLAGNLCRCTGYDKIIHAIQDAAAELREAR